MYGSNVSEWPEALINNVNILKLVQILSVLTTDDEFNYKLAQYEMATTAAIRSFVQYDIGVILVTHFLRMEDLKKENAQLKGEASKYRM